jgi:hypothetical protein
LQLFQCRCGTTKCRRQPALNRTTPQLTQQPPTNSSNQRSSTPTTLATTALYQPKTSNRTFHRTTLSTDKRSRDNIIEATEDDVRKARHIFVLESPDKALMWDALIDRYSRPVTFPTICHSGIISETIHQERCTSWSCEQPIPRRRSQRGSPPLPQCPVRGT